MTAAAMAETGSRTALRRAMSGRPTRDEVLDVALLLLTSATALWGFSTSFDSWLFLGVGILGVMIGITIAHLANTLRQHWLVTMLLTGVAFFLSGCAIALRADTIGGVLPTGAGLRILAALPITGWKDFLTTLPPVDGTGQFLVLPYVIGLVVGALGLSSARRSRSAAMPVTVPCAAMVLVILVGTAEPAGALLQGLAMAGLAVVWSTLRRRRRMHVVGTGASGRSQFAIGFALLLVAAGTSAGLAVHLPGVGATERVVLRTYVTPPFDVAQYPSPLVGFRKYTRNAVQQLWGQPLLQVSGLRAGSLIRFSVMDSYSGNVWSAGGRNVGAAGDFRAVGRVIVSGGDQNASAPVPVTVTIDKAYAAQPDLAAWVPSPGPLTSLDFAGAGAEGLAATVRYNTVTGQAVVASNLSAGDQITMTVRPVQVVGDGGLQPGGAPTVDASRYPSVVAAATKWAAQKATAWDMLAAAAERMRVTGAYSDGSRPGDAKYLPGHSAGRVTAFLTSPQLVGDDEQYAATFALVANQQGVPARVVLGAVVPANGVVHGQDVHAWVEVRDGAGSWLAVPYTFFTPDRNKRPDNIPPPPTKDPVAANVPPPNAQRPPGSLDALMDADPASARIPRSTQPDGIPAWVARLALTAGAPALVVAGLAGLLALVHGARGRRRRRSGSPSRRYAQGWTEVVDRARDLGIAVPTGLTRKEQAALIGFGALAAEADRVTFGPGEPADLAIDDYWVRVRAARRALTRSAARRRRVLRPWAIRSLMVRDRRDVGASTRRKVDANGPRVRLVRQRTSEGRA